MSFWAIVPQAFDLGQQVYGAISGGGTPETEKAAQFPGYRQPSDFVPLLERATAAELGELQRLWVAANAHLADKWNQPEWLASAYVGGEDGKITSTVGRTLKSYLDRMLGKYPPGSSSVAVAPSSTPPDGGSQYYSSGYGSVDGEIGGVRVSAGVGIPPWVYAVGALAVAYAIRGAPGRA